MLNDHSKNGHKMRRGHEMTHLWLHSLVTKILVSIAVVSRGLFLSSCGLCPLWSDHSKGYISSLVYQDLSHILLHIQKARKADKLGFLVFNVNSCQNPPNSSPLSVAKEKTNYIVLSLQERLFPWVNGSYGSNKRIYYCHSLDPGKTKKKWILTGSGWLKENVTGLLRAVVSLWPTKADATLDNTL